jgi:hypothetical protein
VPADGLRHEVALGRLVVNARDWSEQLPLAAEVTLRWQGQRPLGVGVPLRLRSSGPGRVEAVLVPGTGHVDAASADGRFQGRTTVEVPADDERSVTLYLTERRPMEVQVDTPLGWGKLVRWTARRDGATVQGQIDRESLSTGEYDVPDGAVLFELVVDGRVEDAVERTVKAGEPLRLPW